MRQFFFTIMLCLGCIYPYFGYTDEFCPHNKDILDYENILKKFTEVQNLLRLDPISNEDVKYSLDKTANSASKTKNAIDEEDIFLRYMIVIFNELPLNCAEQLVGMGKNVDRQLLKAGFPELASIEPDSIIEYLKDIPLLGDHHYFVKNNERILDFLQREEKNKWFFMGLFQDFDKWHQVHDFALAAKFSLNEKTELEEMKTQAKRAYNPLDFALYLPIWQGEERREQFVQLCLDLGCKLDEFPKCSPEKTEDLWTLKANFIANADNIERVREICNISAQSNGIFAEFWSISDENPINYGLNFRKIGIINSNCPIDEQLNYVSKYGFADANHCENIGARLSQP